MLVMLALFVLLLLAPDVARGQETDGKLKWQYVGFSKLLEAAAEAKTSGKRLLLGLSGGKT